MSAGFTGTSFSKSSAGAGRFPTEDATDGECPFLCQISTVSNSFVRQFHHLLRSHVRCSSMSTCTIAFVDFSYSFTEYDRLIITRPLPKE